MTPSPPPPLLSIVIVNWNTRDLLADCLESVNSNPLLVIGDQSPTSDNGLPITDYRSPTTETIVVDNASTDGSAAMVRERFPWVTLIESGENLGFAAGNNLALQKARGEMLLLLNPDVVVVRDALQHLHACLVSLPSLAAVAPQLEYSDGTLQGSWGDFPALRNELPWLRGHRDGQTLTAGRSQLLAVDWAKGACLMIRRAAWEQVGQLDEDYWLYTEEADWCYRARQLGWTIAILPDVRVIHVEQAASRQNATRSLIQYHRSRALFLRKHGSSLAARTLWSICALKAGLYVLAPERSPLGKGKNDLGDGDVHRAYCSLLKESLQQIARPGAHTKVRSLRNKEKYS